MCAVSVNIHTICSSCTQQGSEWEHLATASVKWRGHLFTSRLCDTDGFELKMRSMLSLWPNLHCWIQLLNSQITVLNLSGCLSVTSGNVNIVPRARYFFCPSELTNSELYSVSVFSYVLARINHRNQRFVIKYRGTQGKRKAYGKSVPSSTFTGMDVAIRRHWEIAFHQRFAHVHLTHIAHLQNYILHLFSSFTQYLLLCFLFK